jgi:hypothetical protein
MDSRVLWLAHGIRLYAGTRDVNALMGKTQTATVFVYRRPWFDVKLEREEETAAARY